MKQYQIEELAAIQHDIWADYMKSLISKCDHSLPTILSALEPGSCILPEDLVEKVVKKMNTTYVDLPEREKEAIRAQARRLEQIL